MGWKLWDLSRTGDVTRFRVDKNKEDERWGACVCRRREEVLREGEKNKTC